MVEVPTKKFRIIMHRNKKNEISPLTTLIFVKKNSAAIYLKNNF